MHRGSRSFIRIPIRSAGNGHWGQVVAMIPSRNAVIVRMGWTVNEDNFDECKFISDVVATLPK